MKINTAIILCAGYGKRLKPLTLKKPKPLININNLTLLENTINLLERLKISNIKLNTYYLQDQIIDFISQHKLKSKIEIIKDGSHILDTGGGILNLIKSSNENDFLVFNPDTIWSSNYIEVIQKMIEFYFTKKIQSLLMIVNKNKSFDKRFKGDFVLKADKLFREKENNYIYTGCQIINKNLFNEINDKIFSISKVWDKQINNQSLYGYESLNNFIHLTDLEIYDKLVKK